MQLTSACLVLGFLAVGVSASERYKSRPDLSPPTLNITIPATEEASSGYIFVCQYSGFQSLQGYDGPEQPAGYIYRDDGDLVWSSLGLLSGWIGNLQVTTYKGKTVLSVFQGSLDPWHGHGFGQATLLNQNYESIRDLRAGNHKVMDLHEFDVQDTGSALIEIYHTVQRDLSAFGGEPGATWIVDAIFQELDIESGDTLFEWHSIDHVDPSNTAVPLDSGKAGNGMNATAAWDYFHINAVDKNDEGDYLLSARHSSTVYKICGKTGEIIWQLGGKQSSFEAPKELTFGFQHDARFLPGSDKEPHIQFISLFDNGARANGHRGGGVDIVRGGSRAKVLRLDMSNMTASVVHSFPHPDGLSAPSQGNVQTLPNSNLFVNWGQAGAVTEFGTSDGKAVFNAYLDSGSIGKGVQSYRGFRFNWTGIPHETPAVVALHHGDGSDSADSGSLDIYVSWNGDTETAQWRFFATDASCTKLKHRCPSHLLGQVDRTGFETSLTVPHDMLPANIKSLGIYAEAVGAQGSTLVVSEVVTSQAAVGSSEEILSGSMWIAPHLRKQGGKFDL